MRNELSNKANKPNENKNSHKRNANIHKLESLSPLAVVEVGSGNTFGIPSGCVPCLGFKLQQ